MHEKIDREILVSPNSFKGSLKSSTNLPPMVDGGEGMLEANLKAAGGLEWHLGVTGCQPRVS